MLRAMITELQMPVFELTDTRNFSDITQCHEEGVSLAKFKSADFISAS